MAAASSSVAKGASGAVRSWRTAFLTLRDEALAAPSPAAVSDLLHAVVLSLPPGVLGAAAIELPVHEVVSDVVFLAELGSAVAECEGVAETLLQVCRLIHNVSCKVRLEVHSSSWIIMLDFFEKILEYFRGKTSKRIELSISSVGTKCVIEIVEILRCIIKGYGLNYSSLDSMALISLLLHIVSSSFAGLLSQSFQNSFENTKSGRKDTNYSNLWELHTLAFSMIGDALSRNGSSISIDTWQFALEVLREFMDVFASKKSLLEGYEMSRFYVALLDCLHLVLSRPGVSLSEHVTGLVVGLKMFLMYGLNRKSTLFPGNTSSREKSFSVPRQKSGSAEIRNTENCRYVPPHLRKSGGLVSHPSDTPASEYEFSKYDVTSSDSDLSDSDKPTKGGDIFRSSKTRIAALVCIQDLCRADPKSLTSIWAMLLPINDVLQTGKYQDTLMACLLFDPVLKTRITSASALSTILEFNSSVFLQVAEYKESSKCGSFTTLSCSLGQILMQIHRGILHLIQHETNGGLLASVFKILALLISATPYSRMPGELLPTVITSISERIRVGPTPKADQTTFMGTAFSCLAAAMSTSPSQNVSIMLKKELSQGVSFTAGNSDVLSVIFHFSRLEVHPTVRFEALQALKALVHNYPNVATVCWEDLSAYVHLMLQSSLPEESKCRVSEKFSVDVGNAVGLANERSVMAAIKVLDEGLRATSGFQGTDDLLECRLLDIQLLSDNRRAKRVSSAPSYESSMFGILKNGPSGNPSGAKQWHEVIEKHLPLVLSHGSPMIRAAGITCFAGMTSSVFFSLENDKQRFIVYSLIFSAFNDEVPSVRSAACRGIGVVACFPQIFSSPKLLDDIFHAVEFNTHHPQISVRITSSWALANICDSLRHRATDLHSDTFSGHVASSEIIALLFETALRLSKDGDKIKSNAIRALGNLSRFANCTENSTEASMESTGASIDTRHWLERMVQAFVSCVTTGNVKVQWNVCHALGNLFLNKTLKLQDVPWAPSVYSILLLLLRDSTNFKIRIHAAVALAVPESRADYGSSFSDILQSLEHVLESIASEQVQDPSSFKYRDALEKQLTLTTLHVLGLGSLQDDQALKDFLRKKATFLEQWLSSLCSSLPQTPGHLEHDASSSDKQENELSSHAVRKQMISRAAKSLSELYEHSNQSRISQRLEKMALGLS
ncbi:unnamed protein product [Spirodela intermedia]|uniref:DUF4042 domain-containing protein n=1 Tax=Spirodela intermedia TaxID=51605 RepID=A0A7I8LLL7_SPIIN|nr:unnamed protein product [Spirodela intermedia]